MKAPANAGLRPSSERVRGALFSMLDAAEVELRRVLDMYAGTGAIGIEALSRGAGWVDFVERDRGLARTIGDNLKATGLSDRGRVHVLDAEKAVGTLSGEYDLIFMDPPYADEPVDRVLGLIGEKGLCSPAGLLIVEHSKRRPIKERYGNFVLEKEKTYGDTMLSIFQSEGSL